MRKLELLAPAKNMKSGMAAIDHGADAVYIGAERFGARAAASNSLDDIRQLCEYAHLFDAKVYVAVNTIIYDEELDDTRLLLRSLKAIGVDAVLIQDMALIQMADGLTLHASTQTDNRTVEKVRWLRSLGFVRVVLARELSLQEISDIHKAVPDVELEVFVHGALCVSYSGLCYVSQHCFGRSANRGACAQFCRMRFDLVDSNGREWEHQRHLLSLKDMNHGESLEQLALAGATSFKIEGRLKDIDYVKNVTAAYSELLNQLVRRHPDLYERSSRGNCTYTFKPNLNRTFNRGYTNYFLNGRQQHIASFDTPKALGEYVGIVKEIRGNSFNVAGLSSFCNGDGLCFFNDERVLEGFRVNRVEGNRLFLMKMPTGLRAGCRLYRSNDQEMERLLSKQSAERKIPVVMTLRTVGDGFELSMDGVVQQFRCEHQKAQKSQRDNIVRQLTKLGGTPYECTDVDMPADFDYFIPSSMLSQWRRQLVDCCLSRSKSHPRQQAAVKLSSSLPAPFYSQQHLYNISNEDARRFYGAPAQTAYEINPQPGAKLMQCRHCLRYSLGYCVKHGGQRPLWKEPVFLCLSDGRRFRLEFDCSQCQMNIYADE